MVTSLSLAERCRQNPEEDQPGTGHWHQQLEGAVPGGHHCQLRYEATPPSTHPSTYPERHHQLTFLSVLLPTQEMMMMMMMMGTMAVRRRSRPAWTTRVTLWPSSGKSCSLWCRPLTTGAAGPALLSPCVSLAPWRPSSGTWHHILVAPLAWRTLWQLWCLWHWAPRSQVRNGFAPSQKHQHHCQHYNIKKRTRAAYHLVPNVPNSPGTVCIWSILGKEAAMLCSVVVLLQTGHHNKAILQYCLPGK